jgi:hypothetical protein
MSAIAGFGRRAVAKLSCLQTLYVGHAVEKGKNDPEDLFVVDEVVKGIDAACQL